MSNIGKVNSMNKFGANMLSNKCAYEQSIIKGSWNFQCIDKYGNIKWEEEITPNLVVNEGLNYILDVALASGTQYGWWAIGLVSSFSYPSGEPGDTMFNHPSWSEFTNYSETERPLWQPGAVASQSVDNSSNKASYSINADGQTVAGGFLVGSTNAGTKGGSSGKLYAVGAFTQGAKSVDNGDTLQVTATFSSSSA